MRTEWSLRLDRATQVLRGRARAVARRGAGSTTRVRDLRPYAELLAREPGRAFGGARAAPDLAAALLGRVDAGGGRGADVVQLSFPSPYEPLHPEFAKQYEEAWENHTALGRLVRPHGAPGPAALLLHDWGAARPGRVIRRTGLLPLGQDGLALAALLLPLHGARAPRGARWSGEWFLSGDVAWTLEAMLQALEEARGLLSWLRERGHAPVGVVGWGLGGLLGALLCAAEPALDFAILLRAPASLSRLVGSDDVPLLRAVRSAIDAQGRLAELPRLWSAADPVNTPALIDADRIRLLGARGDGLVQPHQVEALGRALSVAPAWTPGRWTGVRRVRSRVAGWLGELARQPD